MPRQYERRSPEARLLQGTLEMLVLKIVALEPMHGYGIVQRIQQMSCAALQVRQGSLYPALYRMERRGLLASDWRTNESGHQAKYYTITKLGRRALVSETEGWKRLVGAIDLILEGEA